MTLPKSSPSIVHVADRLDVLPISSLQWRVVIICFVIALLDGFDTQAIAFVGPNISDEFGANPIELGRIFAAGLAGLMIGALGSGPFSDRYGRKPVIICACGLIGGFTIACAVAHSVEVLLILRFLAGIGLGAAMPSINVLTAEYAPERHRTILMTMMFVGFPFGAVIGGILSSVIVAEYGWRAVFLFGGIAPLLLIPIIVGLLPESLHFMARKADRPGKSRKKMIKWFAQIDPEFNTNEEVRLLSKRHKNQGTIRELFSTNQAISTALLWLVFFCNLLVLYGLLNWLPTVMRASGMTADQSIYAAVGLNLGGMLGGLVFALGADKFGSTLPLSISYLGAAFFVGLIGFVGPNPVAVLAVIFCAGAFIIGAQFGMNAVVANHYPTEIRATGLGSALAIGRVGAIIGPLVIASMIEANFGTTAVFGVIASPALFALVALLVFHRRKTANLKVTRLRTTL